MGRHINRRANGVAQNATETLSESRLLDGRNWLDPLSKQRLTLADRD
jgi:hypothetical protein